MSTNSYSTIFPTCYSTQVSLPQSQHPTYFPYPSQMNLVQAFISNFFKINFNIIIPSTYTQIFNMVSFLHVSPLKPKTLPHSCHMPHPIESSQQPYQDRKTIPGAYRFNQKPSHYTSPLISLTLGTHVRDVTEMQLLTSPNLMWVQM